MSMVDVAIALVALFALGAALTRILKSRRSPWRMFFFLLPVLIVLVPAVDLGPAAPDLRVEEALLFLLAPLIVIRRPIHRLAKVELLFLLYGVAILISIFVGYLLDGIVFYRDFFELFRVMKYWLIVRLAISLPWSEQDVSDGMWIFLCIGLVAVCIAFAQTRDSFAINRVYTPLVVPEFRLHSVRYRVVGPFQNSNIFGVFLGMIASAALSMLLFGRLRHSQKGVVSVILTTLIITITRTISKGAFLASMISLVSLWTLRALLERSYRTIYALVLVVGVAMFVVLGNTALETVSFRSGGEAYTKGSSWEVLAYRFQSEVVTGGTTARRLGDWQLALDLTSRSPLFGSGPSKYQEIPRYYHNEYLTHLRRYGIFGLVIYSLLLSSGAGAAIRILRKRRVLQRRFAVVLASSALGVICVFALTGFVYQVFQQLQLAATFWWFVGLTLAYSRSLKSH